MSRGLVFIWADGRVTWKGTYFYPAPVTTPSPALYHVARSLCAITSIWESWSLTFSKSRFSTFPCSGRQSPDQPFSNRSKTLGSIKYNIKSLSSEFPPKGMRGTHACKALGGRYQGFCGGLHPPSMRDTDFDQKIRRRYPYTHVKHDALTLPIF